MFWLRSEAFALLPVGIWGVCSAVDDEGFAGVVAEVDSESHVEDV